MKLKSQKLISSSGSPYLGSYVQPFVIAPYQKALIDKIGRERSIRLFFNRRKRDGILHHVTIIAPSELRYPEWRPEIGKILDFQIVGMGRAFEGQFEAAFVVLSSLEASRLRKHYNLPPRDFHITVGFDPKDIHHKHKDRSSLFQISKSEKERRKFGRLIERFDTHDDVL